MSSKDPLGLESEELIGTHTIEPGPPISFDGDREVEIAAAVARAADAMSELTKYLPLRQSAGDAFRRAIFQAWTQLLEDSKVCDDESLGVPDA